MATSTLTSKGQVTVPKAIRDRLGLVEGDVLEFTVADDGRIIVKRLHLESGVRGVLRDFAPDSPVTVDDMRAAVRRRATERSRSASR